MIQMLQTSLVAGDFLMACLSDLALVLHTLVYCTGAWVTLLSKHTPFSAHRIANILLVGYVHARCMLAGDVSGVRGAEIRQSSVFHQFVLSRASTARCSGRISGSARIQSSGKFRCDIP